MQVKTDIEIDDAVGEEVVIEHAGVGEACHLAWDELVCTRKVGERERRDCGQRLRRVGLLLYTPERVRGFDHSLEIPRGHAGAHRLEPRPFLLCLAFCQIPVGLEDQYGAVAVVDEVALKQPLEIALAARNLCLDGGQRPLEGERRQWIVPVQPGSQRPQHEHDAARKRAGIVLAQTELDCVEGGIDGQWIDALIGQRADGVGHQALDLVGVDRIDALQADRDHRLPQLIVETTASKRLAKSGID